jgi:hypothetical protein
VLVISVGRAGTSRTKHYQGHGCESNFSAVTRAGAGQISRVKQRVRELRRVGGPGYKTGSIIGLVDHDHESDEDEGQVFDLYMKLREWLGASADRAEQKAALARWRVSDVDALTRRNGILDLTAREAGRWLEGGTDHGFKKGMELAVYLNRWLGATCDHQFEQAATEDQRIVVLECNCGVRVTVQKGRWGAL